MKVQPLTLEDGSEIYPSTHNIDAFSYYKPYTPIKRITKFRIIKYWIIKSIRFVKYYFWGIKC